MRSPRILIEYYGLPQLVGDWFQVLFHSPLWGPFHLSLTVLCAIGRQGVFSLGGWSPQIPTGFPGSRGTRVPLAPLFGFAYGALTLYGVASQLLLLPTHGSLNRGPATPPTLTDRWFGLFPFRSPLLRESRLISSPPGTEMFHFPGFASNLRWMTGHDSGRVPPFGHPRIIACLAAPRGFSQPTTSFFASWRLGIHQSPLVS